MSYTPLPLTHGCHELFYTAASDKLLALAYQLDGYFLDISNVIKPSIQTFEASGIPASHLDFDETNTDMPFTLHPGSMNVRMEQASAYFAMRLAFGFRDSAALSTFNFCDEWFVDGNLNDEFGATELIASIEASLEPPYAPLYQGCGGISVLDKTDPAVDDMFIHLSGRLLGLGSGTHTSVCFSKVVDSFGDMIPVAELTIGQQKTYYPKSTTPKYNSTFLRVEDYSEVEKQTFTLLIPDSTIPARTIYTKGNATIPIKDGDQFVGIMEDAFSSLSS